MKVSVVVVTAGRPEAVTRCVDAIAAAALGPAEVVVVDSSPSELSPVLDDRYPPGAFSLRHLRVPRMGVSRARNMGAAQAGGDWVAFTDDDCVPSPQWLQELIRALQAASADGATGAVLPLPDERQGVVAVSSRADPTARVFSAADGRPPWEIGTGGNLLLSKALFERAGGFDLDFGPGGRYRAAEDVELLDRVVRLGAAIAYEPRAVVFHEMKTAKEKMGRRYPYGYGIGALVAVRAGSGARRLATGYGRMQAQSIARGVRRMSPRHVAEPVLGSVGFAAGFCRGLADTRRRSSRISVDPEPRA
jgi:GT2 family glycosyltransferase